MKTYLITGGVGFIGANFIKYMLKKYETTIRLVVLDKLTYSSNLITLEPDLDKIVFIRGDICDQEIVNGIFEKYEINYLINFAAESHVDRSIENPQIFLQSNILGTQNLLEIAKRYWLIENNLYKSEVKFLQVSTDEVYGSLGETGFFTEDTPINPSSPYSASKAGADMIVQAYIKTYKFPANISRCSNNYGFFQFPEKLIPLIIKNILAGQSLPIYGDGRNIRDWLYVEDHCKALDIVLHKGNQGEVYNIGGHNEKENLEIVKLTIDIINNLSKEPFYKSKLKTELFNINEQLIQYVEDRKGHDRRYAIDPAKISRELGWYPETKFEDGIHKTIKWYLENQDWVEHVVSENFQKV